MARPTNAQLETAIMWLEQNEGDTDPDGERSACIAVAIYLEGLLDRRAAREAGITPAYLRFLRKEEKTSA